MQNKRAFYHSSIGDVFETLIPTFVKPQSNLARYQSSECATV